MNSQHKKPKSTQNIWNPSGVSLGEVLGTTSLLATLRWAASEPKHKPKSKPHKSVTVPVEEPKNQQRRVLLPPQHVLA